MSKTKSPIILRLGIKNNWDSKYFEKKTQESATYSLQHLEINKFIALFFKSHGLESKNCKLYYKKNSLHLFIVYHVNTLKLKALLYNNIGGLKIKNSKTKNLKYNFFKSNYRFFKNNCNKNYKLALAFNFLRIRKKFKNKLNFSSKAKNRFKILKKYLTTRENNYKMYKNCLKLGVYLGKKPVFKNHPARTQQKKCKRLYFLKYFNLLKCFKSKSFDQNIFINLFVKKLLTSLNTFLHNKVSVSLTLKQMSRNVIKRIALNEKKNISLNLVSLKKFQKNNYFDSGVNLLYNSFCYKDNISFIIAEYISQELSKLKKPKLFKFFFKFLTKSLKYFLIDSNLIKGIQIVVQGNLGRKPRASSKLYSVGKKIKKLSLNKDLQYNESVCYSKKGTLGIKVWVN
jgi:hypothetical protein